MEKIGEEAECVTALSAMEGTPAGTRCRQECVSKMDWERTKVLNYIGLGEYQEVKRFEVLRARGRDSCIYSKGQIWQTVFGEHSQRSVSCGLLRRLKLKMTVNLLFAHDLRGMDYTRSLNKLYQENLVAYLPIFGPDYCYYAPPYDCITV